MQPVEQVPAAAWQSWRSRTGGVIIDVREPWEWAATGTIPDSETISLSNLREATQRFSPETPILLVCRSGNRSMAAAEFLVGAGFQHVANLTGGVSALAA